MASSSNGEKDQSEQWPHRNRRDHIYSQEVTRKLLKLRRPTARWEEGFLNFFVSSGGLKAFDEKVDTRMVIRAVDTCVDYEAIPSASSPRARISCPCTSMPTGPASSFGSMIEAGGLQTLRSAMPRIHSSISDSIQTVHLGPSDRDRGNRPSLMR